MRKSFGTMVVLSVLLLSCLCCASGVAADEEKEVLWGMTATDLMYEVLCYSVLAGVVIILSFAYIRRRVKWTRFTDLYRNELGGADREDFVKNMNRSILKTTLSLILLLAVLGFAFVFALAFVYVIIGDYVLYLFILVAVAFTIRLLLSVLKRNKLPDLNHEEYSFVHGFVNKVCEKFDLQVPKLKVDVPVKGERQMPNAFTTSFFGRKSIIALNNTILNMHAAGDFTDKEVLSIVGHELGHIVNNDATVSLLLTPFMEFVRGVKTVLELLVVLMLRFIKGILMAGTRSLFGFLFAIGLAFMFFLLLLLVGVYYVMFYAIVLAVDLCWDLYSRQKEYGADLFGALSNGSHTPSVIALMELNRFTGIFEVQEEVAKDIVKDMRANGQISFWESKSNKTLAQVYVQLDIDEILDLVESWDELLSYVPSSDTRLVLQMYKFDKITENGILEYAAHKYTFKEKFRELSQGHPLLAKRARAMVTTFHGSEPTEVMTVSGPAAPNETA